MQEIFFYNEKIQKFTIPTHKHKILFFFKKNNNKTKI